MVSVPHAAWVMLSLLIWLLGPIGAKAQSLLPVTAQGSKFFDTSGKQFYIKGIAYYFDEHKDSLADPEQCALDAPLMQTLLVNTIRVYTVNSTLNHTACMDTFKSHGIYVLLGLATAEMHIDGTKPVWTQELFDQYTKTLSEFSQYDNLLAVYVGNNIINNASALEAAPYIKAAARDVKAYRDAQKMRPIPVGYCSADLGISTISNLRNYLGCGGDNSTTVDFFALNRYTWCGSSSLTLSGYDQLYDASINSPLPLFFSETGCNEIGNRTFDDQQAVLGPDMNGKWSGSVIYEWREEQNQYGIVSYGPGRAFTAFGTSGTPTPITPDFYNLQSQWDTLTPTGQFPASAYTFEGTTPPCPASSARGSWTLKGNAPLPTIKNLVIPTKTLAVTSGATFPIAISTSHGQLIPATSAPNPSSSSSGLSTGGKVAIGLVVPLFFIASVIAALWIWRRNRKARESSNPEYGQIHGMQESNRWSKPELGGGEVAELDSQDARPEADGRIRYQLSEEAAVTPELTGKEIGVEPQELSTGPSVRRKAKPRASGEMIHE